MEKMKDKSTGNRENNSDESEESERELGEDEKMSAPSLCVFKVAKISVFSISKDQFYDTRYHCFTKISLPRKTV